MWFRFPSRRSLDRRLALPLDYLRREQRPDGSWLPLWFGNQHAPDDINPVYGTARVLAAYRDLMMLDAPEAQRGVRFLIDVQSADGGWGGAKGTPSSVEETALAVEVLLAWAGLTPLTPAPLPPKRGERGVDGPRHLDESEGSGKGEPLSPASGERGRGEGVTLAVERGLEYLVRRVEDGTFTEASPIGFYFAKLWYFEKLYPVIFTVAALGRALRSGLGQREGADGG
jgi:squalene-hopene/tetraprenyl-beta-curcumene cyclase